MTQYFKDTSNGEVRILDDAVVAVQVNGQWEFETNKGGLKMNMPTTLIPMTAAEISAFLPAPLSLIQAQNDAYTAIDTQAGITRAKYITTVPGQSETYVSKAADAVAYKAAGYPFASLASYVWVQAEAIAINGASPTSAQAKAAADGILAAQAAWIALGAQIEQARRAGAVAVAAAKTVAAAQAAQAAAIATLGVM